MSKTLRASLNISINDTQQISETFRKREFTLKNDGSTDYSVNLDVWRIENMGGGAEQGPPKMVEEPPLAEPGPADFKDDDIPF